MYMDVWGNLLCKKLKLQQKCKEREQKPFLKLNSTLQDSLLRKFHLAKFNWECKTVNFQIHCYQPHHSWTPTMDRKMPDYISTHRVAVTEPGFRRNKIAMNGFRWTLESRHTLPGLKLRGARMQASGWKLTLSDTALMDLISTIINLQDIPRLNDYIEDIIRWREDMNFIFQWQNNILRKSAASE